MDDQFTSDDNIKKYWGITSQIIEDVLGYDPYGVSVSDASSLWDFCEGHKDILKYEERIKAIFDVEIDHIEGGNLLEISKFILDMKNLSSR